MRASITHISTLPTVSTAASTTIRWMPETAMRAPTAQANYDISNNSWGFTAAFADNGGESYFAPVVDAIASAATDGRGGLGTAMVFAAGNGKLSIGGENVGDDANFHNLGNNRFSIAVGA